MLVGKTSQSKACWVMGFKQSWKAMGLEKRKTRSCMTTQIHSIVSKFLGKTQTKGPSFNINVSYLTNCV